MALGLLFSGYVQAADQQDFKTELTQAVMMGLGPEKVVNLPHMMASTDFEPEGSFVRYTLRQHLNHFTNEINRKFFRTASRFAEFDTTELERADTKSLFESYQLALGGQGAPGFMSQNEIRKRQNLKPIEGGDAINDGSQGPQDMGAQNAA